VVVLLDHLHSPATAIGHFAVHVTVKELQLPVSTSGLPSAPINHLCEV
jgi:hypothetical protein